jgi:hypothetical protein
MALPRLLPYKPTSLSSVPVVGRHGIIQLEARYFRSTWDNQFLEDLSDYVETASVTHDMTRDSANWTLDCTISQQGWKRITPFSDWISPVLYARYAGGELRAQQLGHYVLLDAPEQRDEMAGNMRLDARDVLWVLQSQGVKVYSVDLPQGGRIRKTQEVITGAVVPGAPANAFLRNSILIPPDEPSAWLGPWRDDMRRLEIVNQMLIGGNYTKLFSTEVGVLSTAPNVSLGYETPLRDWWANVPNGLMPVGLEVVDLGPFYGVPSPVVGTIDTTPRSTEMVDEILVVGGLGPSQVAGRATRAQLFPKSGIGFDPTRPTEPVKGGSRQQTYYVPNIQNQETANELAAMLLEKWLTDNTTLTVYVLPDPTFVAINSVVRVGIWDLQGEKVALGKYLVHRVKYGMSADDPLMQVDLGLLEEVSV